MKLRTLVSFGLTTLASTYGVATLAIEPPTSYLTFHNRGQWKLKDSVEKEFLHFLDEERLTLLAQIPELEFPPRLSVVPETVRGETFETYVDARTDRYVNRKVACRFVDKVRAGLQSPAAAVEWEHLTQGGRICIPRDLPAGERGPWVLALAHFFWHTPWLASTNGGPQSLEDHIVRLVGAENYREPRLDLLRNGEVDAYGYVFSQADAALVTHDRFLSLLFDRTAIFDPNDPSTLGPVGHPLRSFVAQDPYELGSAFVRKPLILIADGWSPEALVEVLAHEYGHLFHLNLQTRFSVLGGEYLYEYDRVRDEGTAEAFAWNVLQRVYRSYPEVEIFHILKLRFFAEIGRHEDPHYVGAGAFHHVLHLRHDETPLAKLEALAMSSNLQELLRDWQQAALVGNGTGRLERVPVILE